MRRISRKRLASVTLLDLALGVAAVAAVTPAANAQTPLPSWTGYYIGAHVGYRTANADFNSNSFTTVTPGSTFTIPGLIASLNPDGGIGGAHVGYNFQFNPSWLFGIEGDWTWGRSKERFASSGSGVDTSTDAFTFRRNSELTLTWQGTIRARSGVVFDRWLFYVTGGAAFQHVRWFDTITVNTIAPTQTLSNFSSASKTLTGWVVGAGIEQMLAQNFTWRIEYLYEDFSDFTVPHGLGIQFGNIDLNVHKVRIGFTFKQ